MVIQEGDGRLERGARTRRQILDAAVDIASVEGLEGLTIGDLARRLQMSKSGLFAAFGSKEELQLATVDHAAQIFVNEVVRPALAAPRGMPRLWALCDSWFEYAKEQVFRGGCFFAAASTEFDGRPGQVRDRVAAYMKTWLETLAVAVRKAKDEGHVQRDVDADQLVFELNSIAIGANWANQLFGDPGVVFERARRACRARIESVATASGKLPPPRRSRQQTN